MGNRWLHAVQRPPDHQLLDQYLANLRSEPPADAGISPIAYAFFRNGVTLTSGAVSVAVWTDSPPAVAYQTNNGHTAWG